MLSEAAKKIGDMPAFPCSVTEDCRAYAFGMSYRQWLIGQALAGMLKRYGPDGMARDGIELADAVLERLAAEAAALRSE